MTEILRHSREYVEQQRYIESLGLVAADLQELADKSPDELRGFFYGPQIVPILSKLIKPIVRLGTRDHSYLDMRVLKHPHQPQALEASVHFKRLGEVRRMPFLLRAHGSEPEPLGLMLPMRSGNMLRKGLNAYAMLGEEKAPIVEDPLLAVSAVAEFTKRLRGALGYQEPDIPIEAAA